MGSNLSLKHKRETIILSNNIRLIVASPLEIGSGGKENSLKADSHKAFLKSKSNYDHYFPRSSASDKRNLTTLYERKSSLKQFVRSYLTNDAHGFSTVMVHPLKSTIVIHILLCYTVSHTLMI